MANVYAVKSGNWSDVTVWNTGALPTSADDVYSNTFTVTVDVSPTVLSVRNTSGTGISASGSFSLSNGITLTATNGILAGQPFVSCVTLSGSASASVNANILASSTGDSTYGLTHSGTGTLTLTGNVVGGSGHGNSTGLRLTGGGILNVNGNITGGTQGRGVHIVSGSTVNIIGNITGGGNAGLDIATVSTVNITGSVTGTAQNGVINTSGGTINITGTCTSSGSGTGVNNASTGTINITGTCTGGSSTGPAFVNSSTGTITHIGTAQASASAPAIGAGAIGQVTILTGPLLSTDETYTGGASASGVNPCIAQRWFPKDTALSTFKYTMRAQSVAGIRSERSFYHTNAYTSTYPIVSNVRRNINYGPVGIYTGTMDIPNPQTVGYGVGVGTVTGTALFSVETLWGASLAGITSTGSIGDRLKTTSTVASVAQQISDAFSAR